MAKYTCHHCGYPISNLSPEPDDRCPNCGWHLRVCANCQYYTGTGCMLGEPYVMESAIRGHRCPRFRFRPLPEDTPASRGSEPAETPAVRSLDIPTVRFKTIVAAIDGSPHSARVVAYAAHLAQQHNAKVYLVHAYPPIPTVLGDEQFYRLAGAEVERGRELLKPYADAMLRAGVDVEMEVLEGPAPRAILTVAEAREADLIIVGSRGLGAIRGLVLGSVSERVVRMATCPVLVVH